MDEDGKGIESRHSWVASLLNTQNLPNPDCTQGRCLILSKRNIETWVYWLTGARLNETWQVTEEENYKNSRPAGATRSLGSGDWRAAGRQLHSINHSNPPVGMPAELIVALGKLRQFTQFVRRS